MSKVQNIFNELLTFFLIRFDKNFERLHLEKQQSKICYGEKRKSKGKEKCKRKESEDHRNGNGWKRKEEICND